MKSTTLQQKNVLALRNSGAESVKVIVRCRPYIEKEKQNNEHREECVAIEKGKR